MSVVACPKCAEKVTLPPKTPPAAKVRCPLCGENYLLEEAMATMPPMLEVLELPEGYQPAAEVDISAAAFLASADRPAALDDDDGELKLEEPAGGVAVAESELKPLYDEWGPTRSTAATQETDAAVSPRRELVQTPPRKKRKQVNPLFHMFGIMMGGVLAIPAALLILLWLPGSLRRDVAEIGPWLGENVPFLVPAEFHKSKVEDETASPDDNKTPVLSKPQNGVLSGDSEPEGKSGLGGSQFDDALKEGGFSLDNELQPKARPKPKKPQPKIDDLTDPIIDDTQPEPTPETESELKPELRPEPKPDPDPADEPEPKPETRPDDEPEPKPETKPDDEPTPEPETRPEPEPDPQPEDKPEPPSPEPEEPEPVEEAAP